MIHSKEEEIAGLKEKIKKLERQNDNRWRDIEWLKKTIEENQLDALKKGIFESNANTQKRLELLEECYEKHLQVYHERRIPSDKDTFCVQVIYHENGTTSAKFDGVQSLYGVGFSSNEAQEDLETEFSKSCKFMFEEYPELLPRLELAHIHRLQEKREG